MFRFAHPLLALAALGPLAGCAARLLVTPEHGPGLVETLLADVEGRGSVQARVEGRIRLQSSGVSP